MHLQVLCFSSEASTCNERGKAARRMGSSQVEIVPALILVFFNHPFTSEWEFQIGREQRSCGDTSIKF